MTAAAEASREQWLAERKTGIGSSDAAAALGLDPYKTPLQLYREKRGEAEPDDLSENKAIYFGTRLEDFIAAEYTIKTGHKLQRINQMLRSKTQPFMLANIDRKRVGKPIVVELKTAGFWAAKKTEDWGEESSDLVPVRYYMQVQHQIAVGDYEAGDLAVFIAGQDLRIYHIERDEDVIATMVTREAEFWQRILDGNPPPPRSLEDTAALFPQSQADFPIEANNEIAQLVGDIYHAKREIKSLEEKVDDAKLKVQAFMGTAEVLTFGGQPIAKWKTGKKTSLDSKRLEKELPAVYEQFVRRGTQRRFTLPGDE